MQKQRYAFPHARFYVRAGGQRDAAKDCRALRCACQHPDQDAGGLLDIAEVNQPALDLKAQPIRQRRGGAGNAVPVERRRQIGELASLLQDDALKRDDIRVERKVGARQQRCVQETPARRATVSVLVAAKPAAANSCRAAS